VHEKMIATLGELSEHDVDISVGAARDALWAALADLFDKYREEQGLTYADVARRIHRSRSQVQRWLAAPSNMTLVSAGLIAEGLNADLQIQACPRVDMPHKNYVHPCEEAKAYVHVGKSWNLIHHPIEGNESIFNAPSGSETPNSASVAFTWRENA